MIISERIFKLIDERGMTQKEFSDQTGISQSTISDWKRKKTNPASDKIMIICDVLNVTPYELLSGTESDSFRQLDYIIVNKQSDEYRLLEVLHTFDLSQKQRLEGYIDALRELPMKNE